MKITIEQALAMFSIVKQVSYKDVKSDKISLIWLKLYPIVKEWDDAQMAANKDVEEVRKSFEAEVANLSEEEKQSKMQDIDRRFREAVDALPSVKAQPALLKEEREADIPTITEEEYIAITHCECFKNIGEVAPIAILIGNE